MYHQNTIFHYFIKYLLNIVNNISSHFWLHHNTWHVLFHFPHIYLSTKVPSYIIFSLEISFVYNALKSNRGTQTRIVSCCLKKNYLQVGRILRITTRSATLCPVVMVPFLYDPTCRTSSICCTFMTTSTNNITQLPKLIWKLDVNLVFKIK